MKIHGYYFITDEKLSKAGNISDVKNALDAGVSIVQYRNKGDSRGVWLYAPTKQMYQEALKLKQICKGRVLFLVNDRIDIALAVDADGVHLGTEDMPYSAARKILGKKKIIGLTVHNIEEAKEAEGAEADYIGVSPIFATDTKKDAGEPVGLDLIKRIKKAVNIPIVAIGGITLGNVPEVIKAGSDAICAISAVVTKEDVRTEIERFQKYFKKNIDK